MTPVKPINEKEKSNVRGASSNLRLITAMMQMMCDVRNRQISYEKASKTATSDYQLALSTARRPLASKQTVSEDVDLSVSELLQKNNESITNTEMIAIDTTSTMSPYAALRKFVSERYTLSDVENSRQPEEYFYRMVELATNAGINDIFIQLLYAKSNIDVELRLILPTLKASNATTISGFVQDLKNFKGLWFMVYGKHKNGLSIGGYIRATGNCFRDIADFILDTSDANSDGSSTFFSCHSGRATSSQPDSLSLIQAGFELSLPNNSNYRDLSLPRMLSQDSMQLFNASPPTLASYILNTAAYEDISASSPDRVSTSSDQSYNTALSNSKLALLFPTCPPNTPVGQQCRQSMVVTPSINPQDDLENPDEGEQETTAQDYLDRITSQRGDMDSSGASEDGSEDGSGDGESNRSDDWSDEGEGEEEEEEDEESESSSDEEKSDSSSSEEEEAELEDEDLDEDWADTAYGGPLGRLGLMFIEHLLAMQRAGTTMFAIEQTLAEMRENSLAAGFEPRGVERMVAELRSDMFDPRSVPDSDSDDTDEEMDDYDEDPSDIEGSSDDDDVRME